MSVYLTIPSARPPEEAEKVLSLWRRQGYKIALYLDPGKDGTGYGPLNLTGVDVTGYPGYAIAVNRLIADVMKLDPDAEWFVAAGDDVEPDLNHTAEGIAAQCADYFAMNKGSGKYRTFGVMQPTGDRWGEGHSHGKDSAYIDRVCGSAWIGREFARRMYRGNGPLFPDYRHMFVDEELQEVAVKMGVLWQRRDLIQYHRHWGRTQDGSAIADPVIPDHLKEVNSGEHWRKYKALFEERKRKGFPGHEPV